MRKETPYYIFTYQKQEGIHSQMAKQWNKNLRDRFCISSQHPNNGISKVHIYSSSENKPYTNV